MSSHVVSTLERIRPAADLFAAEVIAGLSRRPRTLSPRWFYDRRGSELFEAITQLPEYYLTRAERRILLDHSADIAQMAGNGRALVEFGSGSSLKTPLLLEALAPTAYVPIDISGDFLRDSTAILAQKFPALSLHPVAADFMHPLVLPSSVRGAPLLGYFAGSTIGNMSVPVAVDFLRNTVRTLGEDALLLIGIDRVKETQTLLAAYDDAQGVTAQFNLNLLHRIERELQATIPVEAFRHLVRWNDSESRIEMHLEALRDVDFTVAGTAFSMVAGETIHTENSLKYGSRDARALLRAGHWSPLGEWTDPESLFLVILASARQAAPPWEPV
jgi:L-histidine Nalpha-methyltransferase